MLETRKTKTMSVNQVYEQAIKPLSAEEKLAIARLIMDEVVPEAGPQIEARDAHLNGIPSQSEPNPPAKVRRPREFGAGRHLLSEAGIDVDELMATPIDDMFAEYMPEEH